MSAVAPIPERIAPLKPEDVRRAKEEAASTGRSVIAVLEDQTGLPAAALVEAVGLTLHYPTASMDELYQLVPAFDMLPFAEAMQHECILFEEHGGGHCLVFSDPFTARFRRWAEERLSLPFTWRLAHPSDVAAYLARHEDGLRAMDALLPATNARTGTATAIDDLSLKTISEDTSPVIRLVHSTLYDALKAGASDIHLETVADGLNIRYRVSEGIGVRFTGVPEA